MKLARPRTAGWSRPRLRGDRVVGGKNPSRSGGLGSARDEPQKNLVQSRRPQRRVHHRHPRSIELPYDPRQRETRVEGDNPGSAPMGTGAYPRLAEALKEAPAPGDADELFDRMLNRLLDSFA